MRIVNWTGLAALFLFAAAGCEAPSQSRPTVLDAAGVYEEDPSLFVSIRAAYPGPFEDFRRLPARDPAKRRTEDARFLKRLREQTSVAYLDLLPLDGGADEIDVILGRYNVGDDWMTVGLIYSDKPITAPGAGASRAVFPACNEKALEWLGAVRAPRPVQVVCRLDRRWYAYQRVD